MCVLLEVRKVTVVEKVRNDLMFNGASLLFEQDLASVRRKSHW